MLKRIVYSTALCLMAIMQMSCDNCTPPDIAENIIGEWEVVIRGENVEFRADGTLIDLNDALIGGEGNGVVYDEKSYEITDELNLKVRAEKDSQFVEAEYLITEHKCNEIKIEIFGAPARLKRQ